MKSMIHRLMVVCLSFSISGFYSTAQANEGDFSSTGLSLLYGSSFKIPMKDGREDKSRYVITIDSINKRSWGDAFGFLDIERSIEEPTVTSLYGEFTPRLNLPQDIQPRSGLIEKFLFAPSIEYGASATGYSQVNYLYGLGTNLRLPLFKVFQLNFFKRINQHKHNNWQITPVWLAPFSIGEFDYVFSGWLDFSTATHNVPASVHTQSQYMLDVGKFAFKKKQVFYLGAELRIWKNKFWIRGINENVLQLLAMVRI